VFKYFLFPRVGIQHVVHGRNNVVYGKHKEYIKIGGCRVQKGYDSYHKAPYVE
jgi:hypothetical protein